MAAILLPLLAAAFTPSPPTTVNGQVLGTAEEFATYGPERVCLGDMVVSPNGGEVVYVEYLGIHNARLRLVLADGAQVELVQGDAFLDRRSEGQAAAIERSGQRYYLVERGADPLYQRGAPAGATGESSQMLLVSGSALAGDRSDETIFDRLTFGADQVARCDRRFGYGWDGIFWTRPAAGDAP